MNMQSKGRCKDCRYWSEMLAMAEFATIKAVCLVVGGRYSGKWVAECCFCSSWADNHLGAIDSPGFDGTEYNVRQETSKQEYKS